MSSCRDTYYALVSSVVCSFHDMELDTWSVYTSLWYPIKPLLDIDVRSHFGYGFLIGLAAPRLTADLSYTPRDSTADTALRAAVNEARGRCHYLGEKSLSRVGGYYCRLIAHFTQLSLPSWFIFSQAESA